MSSLKREPVIALKFHTLHAHLKKQLYKRKERKNKTLTFVQDPGLKHQLPMWL